MKKTRKNTVLTLMLVALLTVLVLVVGCAKQAPLEEPEEDRGEPIEIKQAEESKVVPPDLEKGVGEVSIEGEEGTFLSRIINMMVEELS